MNLKDPALGVLPPIKSPPSNSAAVGDAGKKFRSSDFIRSTSDAGQQGQVEKTASNLGHSNPMDTENAHQRFNNLFSMQQSENSIEAASNNGLSVSRVFNRPNLRSLSLASVSDLAKVQIANYVNAYIASNAGNAGSGAGVGGFRHGLNIGNHVQDNIT